MRKEDAADYECSAENGVGQVLTKRISVSVTGTSSHFQILRFFLLLLRFLLTKMRRWVLSRGLFWVWTKGSDQEWVWYMFWPYLRSFLALVTSNGEFELFLELILINAVADVPKISPFSFPQRLSTGSKATVTCTTSSGSEPLTFQWLKDGHELGSQSKIDVANLKSSSLLEITKIQEHHDGRYTCKVTNPFGSDSFTASLEIECELF